MNMKCDGKIIKIDFKDLVNIPLTRIVYRAELDRIEFKEEEMCEKCKSAPQKAPHTCPFKSEIYVDETLCTCCDDCIGNCCLEI